MRKEMLKDLRKIKNAEKFLDENIQNFIEKFEDEIHPEDVAKRELEFVQEHPDYNHDNPEHRKIYTDYMLEFIESKIKAFN